MTSDAQPGDTHPDLQPGAALDLNPDGGLTTLVDLRRPTDSTDSSMLSLPSVVRDPNELRLERMLGREHLVYGVPTPFVGRREDLEKVYNLVRDAVNSTEIRTIALVGGPGCGKTRLLAELFAIIDPLRRGIEVLSASCSESEAPDGLGIVTQVVRRRFNLAPTEREGVSRDKIVEAVDALVQPRQLSVAARFLGYLAGLRTIGLGTNASEGDVARFQWRALKTFYNLLRYDARRTPQIIVFHRSQYLTQRAAEALRGLIDALSDTPTVLIFVGDRVADVKLLDASPAHLEVSLEALGRRDADRLARAILHKVPDLPDGLVDDILGRSAGNPGLIEDNIRLLIQRGVVVPSEDVWTFQSERMTGSMNLAATVEAASRARVAGLAAPLREILEMAAVFGSAFWRSGVLSLLRTRPHPPGPPLVPWVNDVVEARLNAQLAEALRQDVVVAHGHSAVDGHDEFSFVHRADRTTLYEELDPDRRELYHRLVAQWLARRQFADPRPWYEAIGNHLEVGQRPEPAAEYFLDAARMAQEAYDLARARELHRRALALIDLDRGEVLVDVLDGLGDTCYRAGSFHDARKVYGALLEATLVVADVPAGALAWLKLGRAHSSLGDYARARPCLNNALNLYRGCGDSAGIASAMEQVAKLAWLTGGEGAYDHALGFFRQALEIRRRLDDSTGMAESLHAIANVQLQRGELEEARGGFTEALEMRRRAGDRGGEALSQVGLGAVHYALEDYPGAISAWSAGLELAELVGDRELIGAYLNNLGEAYLLTGDLKRAETVLHEAHEVTRDTGDLRTAADVARNRGALAVAQGELDEALAFADEAMGIADQIGARPARGQTLRTKGEILGRLRRGDEAIAAFDEAITIFEEVGDDLELRLTLSAYAQLLEGLGATQKAERLRERAAALRP